MISPPKNTLVYQKKGGHNLTVKPTDKKNKHYIKAINIEENLKITLEYIRDLGNVLGIVKHMDQPGNAVYKDVCPTDKVPIQNTYHNIKQQMASAINGHSGDVDSRSKKPMEHTIYFVVELSNDLGKPIITSVKNFSDLGKEVVEFPFKVRDLSIHATVSFSIYDMNKIEDEGLVASTTINLFDSKRRLRQGFHNLYLWKDKPRDLTFKCTTPGLPPDNEYASKINALLGRIDDRSAYDLMTHRAIKRQLHQYYVDSQSAFLEISLPIYDYPILYHENVYKNIKRNTLNTEYLLKKYEEFYCYPFSSSVKFADPERKSSTQSNSGISGARIIKFHDPVIMRKGTLKMRKEQDNPILEKYYILTRTNDDNIARGLNIDRETHKQILDIIEQPDFAALTQKEETLLWKYRYPIKYDEQYLKAVVKFLRSVDWDNLKESNEAIQILQDWNFDIEQAIPMLSVMFSVNDLYEEGIAKHKCVEIRKRAIEVLEQEDTEFIQKILLQLVQAYRYEDFEAGHLKNFLMAKVVLDESIAHDFFWIVKLEKDNQENSEQIRHQFSGLYDAFIDKLTDIDPECRELLAKQWEFRDKLYSLSKHVGEADKVQRK